MTNMLRFLNFLFLGVCAYLISSCSQAAPLDEESNYSRNPIVGL